MRVKHMKEERFILSMRVVPRIILIIRPGILIIRVFRGFFCVIKQKIHTGHIQEELQNGKHLQRHHT